MRDIEATNDHAESRAQSGRRDAFEFVQERLGDVGIAAALAIWALLLIGSAA